MTQTAHTPGPWAATPDALGVEAPRSGVMKQIADCDCHGAINDDREVHANARLIAAAPDLLRACELALAHVPRTDDAPDGGIHGLMERAIAKAKGE